MDSLKSFSDIGDELCDSCQLTDYGISKVNTGPHNLCEGSSCCEAYETYLEDYKFELQSSLEVVLKEKRVLFNGIVTVVLWEDGTKTVVKCSKDDNYDMEKGFLMAYFRKSTGFTKTQVRKYLKKITTKERFK